MDWRERAAEGLPAPRDDEPATLRQNILDELADHLDCALKRELTKNITPDEAVENVKRRFGDPRDLARRLWLDAMKDTIMSKRLTLAAMGLMFVMCLLLGWMAWTSQRASQEAAASIRQANGELLKQLTTLLARPAPGASSAPDRVPVRFHLVCDDAKKSPARGYEGTLTNGGFVNALQRTSGENGDLDFGMLPAGSYSVALTSPWHETTTFGFNASLGLPISSPIVCPAHDWLPAEVSFKLIGLPSLKDREALIICRLFSETRRQIGSLFWTRTPGDGGQQNWGETLDVALDQMGRIICLAEVSQAAATEQMPMQYKLAPENGRSSGFPGRNPSQCFQHLAETDHFSWLVDGLKHPSDVGLRDRKYIVQGVTIILASDIRRLSGDAGEKTKLPLTLLTWEPGWTPLVEGGEANAFKHQPTFRPVAGHKIPSRSSSFPILRRA